MKPLRRWLLFCAGVVAVQAGAVEAPADTELAEIVIRAPEPRYVAPTRRDRIGRIWAPVMINGRGPFRMVLDTGATHSAILAVVAGELGISLADAPKVLLRGVTGTAIVPMVRARLLTVGDLELEQVKLPIVPTALGGAEGVLGTDGFDDKRILIDFRNDLIIVRHSRLERPATDLIVLPLERTGNRLLAVTAYVGGIRTRAIIDTGGQASIGNLALRNALHKRRQEQGATEDEITGTTEDTQTGEGYNAPPIEFNSLRLQGSHITFGDMRIFEHWGLTETPALLIGMDTLGLLDTLIIDYRRRELQMRLHPTTRS